MLKNRIYHLGVVTSYVYTFFYVADESNALLEEIVIENVSFNNNVTEIIDSFLKCYFSFRSLTLFLGPAPLVSCRTTLIFFQIFAYIKAIPLIAISGGSYYFYNDYDVILIQNFAGIYSVIDKEGAARTISSENELIQETNNKRVGLVGKKGHEIFAHHAFILIPNIEKIIICSRIKYINKEFTAPDNITCFF